MRADGSEEALAGRLAEILALRVERDREKGYTSAGPHMDDVTLALDGRGARSFGSQGQQRALVLALKIAEIENLRAALGRPPLLLLDDVSSELDPEKNGHLLRHLAALPGQAFLTTTDRRLLEPATGAERSSTRSATASSSAKFPQGIRWLENPNPGCRAPVALL